MLYLGPVTAYIPPLHCLLACSASATPSPPRRCAHGVANGPLHLTPLAGRSSHSQSRQQKIMASQAGPPTPIVGMRTQIQSIVC